jgi:hypothetical protein
MTRAEQETLVRWDQAERVAHLCTTYPPMVRRWQRCGYAVQVLSTTLDGQARSWAAVVPVACITFRRLAAVQRRTRTRTGVPGLAKNPRTLTGSEVATQSDEPETAPRPDLGLEVAP